MRNAGPVIAVLALLALAVLLAMAPWGDSRFDRSPLGVRGLELWLKAKGVDVVRSNPRLKPNASDMSIRVLPLPGTDSADQPETQLEPWVLEEKLYEMPTLVVLPKWKDGLAKEGIARGAMLIPDADAQSPLSQMYLDDVTIIRLGARFEQVGLALDDSQPHKVALYRAQLFDRASLPDHCTELAGLPPGALLISCDPDFKVWVLSDPDLINNHGLSLAENAAFAVSMIAQLRGPEDRRPIYLDTDPTLLTESGEEDEGRSYERSASDLARLLDYPLSVIWAAALLVTAIAFWRGAYRFGPPQTGGEAANDVSRTAAIEAVARLLRLSGNDGRLTAQFVHDLLADKTVQVFGPGSADAAGIERLFDRLARRDARAADALRTVSRSLMEQGPTMSRAELHRNLHTFKELLGSTDLGSR
ncbi:hypothetical protein [Aquamicrobium defluvii]|uniref:DUF4350 domain-containing protein n=1 Tax=Aquamicrobium defluvii TaxID=69279 RepID=A0A011V1W0_9HYPH|nr:hypothetical protein [Aquamicrobium defluvii]EXL02425.1 hypothetical protein BG36_15185 [Aquamicrobium defluvii]EZQ13080.1 hypothetical protein CF98_29500 [Halopseudomonas bauzanensis]TDR32938.1 hypothetical protein DES43_12568 [Aquamicrobium defluvii]